MDDFAYRIALWVSGFLQDHGGYSLAKIIRDTAPFSGYLLIFFSAAGGLSVLAGFGRALVLAARRGDPVLSSPTPTTPDSAGQGNVKSTQDVAQSAPIVPGTESGATRYCGQCGSLLLPQTRYCGACGAATQQTTSPSTTSAPLATPSAPRNCDEASREATVAPSRLRTEAEGGEIDRSSSDNSNQDATISHSARSEDQSMPPKSFKIVPAVWLLGIAAIVVTATTAIAIWVYFFRNTLPACGSPEATETVLRIVSENVLKDLDAEQATTMSKSLTLSLDMIEKGDLSSDGNVRECRAKLRAGLSPDVAKATTELASNDADVLLERYKYKMGFMLLGSLAGNETSQRKALASAKKLPPEQFQVNLLALQQTWNKTENRFAIPLAYQIKALEDRSRFVGELSPLQLVSLHAAVTLIGLTYEPPAQPPPQPASPTAVAPPPPPDRAVGVDGWQITLHPTVNGTQQVVARRELRPPASKEWYALTLKCSQSDQHLEFAIHADGEPDTIRSDEGVQMRTVFGGDGVLAVSVDANQALTMIYHATDHSNVVGLSLMLLPMPLRTLALGRPATSETVTSPSATVERIEFRFDDLSAPDRASIKEACWKG